MEIDARKLAALDEAKLATMIYEVCRSMGMSEEKARKMAQNAPAMRSMLAKASEKDLNRIVSMVGEKRAAEILAGIEGKGSDTVPKG